MSAKNTKKSASKSDSASTKVGAEAVAVAETEEKTGGRKRNKRPEWDRATAIDSEGETVSLDENGRLTGIPANWTNDFRPLGRSAFASRTLQLTHKLFVFDADSAKRDDRRTELVDEIEEATKGLTPKAKKVKKAARLKKQLAALKAELAAQGVEID